jgi:hypothetical protein
MFDMFCSVCRERLHEEELENQAAAAEETRRQRQQEGEKKVKALLDSLHKLK